MDPFQNYYRKTSREIKRISSVTLSPVYAHFSESLCGLITIRAHRETDRLVALKTRKFHTWGRKGWVLYEESVVEKFVLFEATWILLVLVLA